MTLIAFGGTTKVFSDRLLACNKTDLGKARGFAAQLNADMGGMEIRKALQAAYAAVRGTEAADIFLVTDGEVSSWESVVADAKRSGHRIFAVGIGSAVSEAFVRGLAADTGGKCELVSPREGMAERVIRHFERMRASRAKRVAVHRPEGAHDISPSKLGADFEGDTEIACARFDRPQIGGNIVLEVETDKGDVFRQELQVAPAPESTDGLSTVARVAASARLTELDTHADLEMAIRYRLVSPWTNWLVVAERPEGEKALDIPALRKVPQTMAAGWGEAGLASEFDDLFRHAADLGLNVISLNVSAIGAMVLAGILDGPLRKCLSSGVQGAIASLQDFARRAMDALREMGRGADALLQVTRDADTREVLEPEQARAVQETLERLVRVRELPKRLREWAQRSEGQIKKHPAAHTRCH